MHFLKYKNKSTDQFSLYYYRNNEHKSIKIESNNEIQASEMGEALNYSENTYAKFTITQNNQLIGSKGGGRFTIKKVQIYTSSELKGKKVWLERENFIINVSQFTLILSLFSFVGVLIFFGNTNSYPNVSIVNQSLIITENKLLSKLFATPISAGFTFSLGSLVVLSLLTCIIVSIVKILNEQEANDIKNHLFPPGTKIEDIVGIEENDKKDLDYFLR